MRPSSSRPAIEIVTPRVVIGSAESIGRSAAAACWRRSSARDGRSWRLICAGVSARAGAELVTVRVGAVDVARRRVDGVGVADAACADRERRGRHGANALDALARRRGHARAPGAVMA